jgi:hypothetical protein
LGKFEFSICLFDTYVKPGSARGYGMYDPHPSNTFSPREPISLYVEPVGYTFTPIKSEGNTLAIDLSADIMMSDPSRREFKSFHDIAVGNVTSHHKNTEIFLLLDLTPDKALPEGDFIIKYVVRDNPSGKTFDIIKEITIAAGDESRRGVHRSNEESLNQSDITSIPIL